MCTDRQPGVEDFGNLIGMCVKKLLIGSDGALQDIAFSALHAALCDSAGYQTAP